MPTSEYVYVYYYGHVVYECELLDTQPPSDSPHFNTILVCDILPDGSLAAAETVHRSRIKRLTQEQYIELKLTDNLGAVFADGNEYEYDRF